MTTSWAANRSAALAVCLAAAGCTDRTGAAEEGAAPVTVAPNAVQPPTPPCREAPAGRVLSSFASGPCGSALVADERGVGLWRLSADDPEQPARGDVPDACGGGGCTYFGYDSVAGPLVLALVAGPRSEMPTGVWLGLAMDPAGQQLVFFDLWAGGEQSVVGDGTDLGPPHSLAPFVCPNAAGESGFALFTMPRLAAGMGVEPVKTMAAREGVYSWSETTATRADADRSRCAPISIELP